MVPEKFEEVKNSDNFELIRFIAIIFSANLLIGDIFRIGHFFKRKYFCFGPFHRSSFSAWASYSSILWTSDDQKCGKVQILCLSAGLKGVRSEDIIAAF